jgi:two-component system sensor histidine kinase CreC
MHLGLRLLFGFFVIAGLAAVFVLRVFLTEVKPSVREVMEDVLVDSANLLAEQAAPDLRAMPAGGTLPARASRPGVQRYLRAAGRRADLGPAQAHAGLARVYVTDASGRVVFDSGNAAAPGPTTRAGATWR